MVVAKKKVATVKKASKVSGGASKDEKSSQMMDSLKK